MAGAPHVLLIPFPAQGHVVPFMALAHSLVAHGFTVSFLNTHFNHDRLCSASSEVEDADDGRRRLRMLSIPDGLATGEDRADLAKLVDGFTRVMPPCLEELIRKTNDGHEEVEEEERIRWIIADENMGWAFAVAKKMGVRAAAYWCASAACLSLHISIPKLIQDYVLHENGLPRRNDDDDDEYFDLSSGFPPIKTTQFSWNCAGGGAEGQKIIFDLVISNNRALELADFIIVNSSHDLEPSAFTLFPNLLPIGPLFTTGSGSRRLDEPKNKKPFFGHFWRENSACIQWLGLQSKSSVIYVAFGSFTLFGYRQLQELALALELTGRPFLWVVRPDSIVDSSRSRDEDNNNYAEEECFMKDFLDRVAGRGMVLEWCPQQEVLAHPSLACFVSHCGWNSTLEGTANGVPFLCWPYFTDQFINQSYICNIWKTGLSLDADGGADDRIFTRTEIKEKLHRLLADDEIKARALVLKESVERSISEEGGGSSYHNLKSIVDLMKGSMADRL